MNSAQNLLSFLDRSNSFYHVRLRPDGRFLYANKLFRTIFGYAEEDLTELNFQDHLHPEDMAEFIEHAAGCMVNKDQTASLDLRRIRKDGSLFWTRWEFSCTLNDAGEFEWLQGIGNDISERKRAEIEKQLAQADLAYLLNNTDESFIMTDTNLSILSYNQSANTLIQDSFGASLKKGLPVIMFSDPERYDELEVLLTAALGGNAQETELVFKSHEGIPTIYSTSIKPVYTEDEQLRGIIITHRDITAKKYAEDQLKRNEQHFRGLIENSADGLIIVTDSGYFSQVSPSAERMLGMTADELRDHNPSELVHPEDLELIKSVFIEIAASPGHIKTIEYRTLVREGYKWISATYHNLLHEDSIRGIVINFSDITQRKHAETALQQSEEKYRFLFYMNPQPMWIYDPQTLRFLEVNEAAVHHYGYSFAEFLSMKITEIRPEEEVGPLLERINSLHGYRGLLHGDAVWQHIKKNGEVIYVQIKSHTLDYNDMTAILVSVNDITFKVKAEQELKKSNERFTYAVKATSEAIWEWEISTNGFYIAPSFSELTGHDPQLYPSFTELHRFIHPEDYQAALQSFQAALSDPAMDLWQAEYRFKKANGDYAYLGDRGWIIRDEEGKALKVVGSVRDLTKSKEYEQELKKSNERFELAGKATSDAIWDADILNETIHWGEGFGTLFGYNIPTGTTSAWSWVNYIHPDDKERVLKVHYHILENEKDTNFWKDEYRFIRADGTVAYVIDKGVIMRDQEGKPYRMIGAMQDITERKIAEQQLAAERHLLRTLIDHLPDYIYVKDTESRHVINNKANIELIGATEEAETLGKTAFDYFDRDTAAGMIERDKKILSTGQPLHNNEEAVTTPKGDRRWLLTTKVPLIEDGRIKGVVGVSRDITERKKMEESLRISNERYNIMSRATNDVIWDWDLRNDTIIWNEGISHVFGYNIEVTPNAVEWWERNIHPDDRQRIVSSIWKNIDRGIDIWNGEYRYRCSDGSYKHVFDRGFLLVDENNRPTRMIGAMMDITERKALQEELEAQKLTRQRQITEATILTQEKERAMIGRELHDNINQILTTTKLYIDMAISEKEIREELLAKSHKNVSSAIEEIRVLSKSLVPPSLGDIGIREAITEMINNLNSTQKIEFRLRASGFSKVQIPDNIKLMVFRIVQEQVNNILKHSKATDAEIKLAVSRKMLNITVMDNGIGFDPKRRTKGIGLSNITSRAELHNGRVEILTAPGKGCVLKVSIPIH